MVPSLLKTYMGWLNSALICTFEWFQFVGIHLEIYDLEFWPAYALRTGSLQLDLLEDVFDCQSWISLRQPCCLSFHNMRPVRCELFEFGLDLQLRAQWPVRPSLWRLNVHDVVLESFEMLGWTVDLVLRWHFNLDVTIFDLVQSHVESLSEWLVHWFIRRRIQSSLVSIETHHLNRGMGQSLSLLTLIFQSKFVRRRWVRRNSFCIFYFDLILYDLNLGLPLERIERPEARLSSCLLLACFLRFLWPLYSENVDHRLLHLIHWWGIGGILRWLLTVVIALAMLVQSKQVDIQLAIPQSVLVWVRHRRVLWQPFMINVFCVDSGQLFGRHFEASEPLHVRLAHLIDLLGG